MIELDDIKRAMRLYKVSYDDAWSRMIDLLELSFEETGFRKLTLIIEAEKLEYDLTGDCDGIGPYVQENYTEILASAVEDYIDIRDCVNCRDYTCDKHGEMSIRVFGSASVKEISREVLNIYEKEMNIQ